MITTRKAASEDIDELKKVVVESVPGLCKDRYTQLELKSLLAQYPGRELYENWFQTKLLIAAEDEGKIVGFAQSSLHPRSR